VAVHTKKMTVYFYSIEPAPRFGGDHKTFEIGSFPLGEVLDAIRALDPASAEYRIQDNLFGGETFCMPHEDGPQLVLGAYYKDKLSRPLAEYKGEVSELYLRDGEALVDAAYAAFFPGDVMGLVRTSSKAPGFAKIGDWISIMGGYPCALLALRDQNTLMQLDRNPTAIRRFLMRIRRERIAAVEAHSPNVAGALRAASDLNPLSSEVAIEQRITSAVDQGRWSTLVHQEIEELMGVLPDFQEAKVKMAGFEKPVNLLRATIQHTVEVSIVGSRRVGPSEAAEALFGAYAHEADSINHALRIRDER
jgi:hypothetical protein